ncbi:hypothetical protein J6590_077414 [Homalodisca vitripennis]|nr:hypothetical protein J6590_077414 [Homalodisca vitripennis]
MGHETFVEYAEYARQSEGGCNFWRTMEQLGRQAPRSQRRYLGVTSTPQGSVARKSPGNRPFP